MESSRVAEPSGGTEEQWRDLVAKVLKGQPFERLVTTTLDGIDIQPLYLASPGAPGQRVAQAPYGRSSIRPRGTWVVYASVDHPDPATANRWALDELEQGANGLLVRIADPSRFGDHTMAYHSGVVLDSADDLATVLDGVYLDAAPVRFDAGAGGLQVGRWFAELVRSERLPTPAGLVRLGIEPVTSAALRGASLSDLDAEFEAAFELQRVLGPSGCAVLCLNTEPWVGNGASDAQELGLLLALAAEHLRRAEQSPTGIDGFLDSFAVNLALTPDQFTTIAKLRAARVLWSHLLHSIGREPQRLSIDAQMSGYFLTRFDPWVNMLRGTTAALAGVLGGADGMWIPPFDAALGVSTPHARRVARNTQLLCQDESRLGRPADPAGGSAYLEALTDELVAHGWRFFQSVEAQGGLASAVESGWVFDAIDEMEAKRQRLVATRRLPITGISEFPLLDEAAVATVDVSAFVGSASTGTTASHANVRRLVPRRLAGEWERLRSAVQPSGATVRLVTLGSEAEHGPRLQWTRNAFAAAGFSCDVRAWPRVEDIDSGLVCVVGTDDAYVSAGVEVVSAVAPKVAAVWIAGRAPNADELRRAGATMTLAAGEDILERMRSAAAAVGIR